MSSSTLGSLGAGAAVVGSVQRGGALLGVGSLSLPGRASRTPAPRLAWPSPGGVSTGRAGGSSSGQTGCGSGDMPVTAHFCGLAPGGLSFRGMYQKTSPSSFVTMRGSRFGGGRSCGRGGSGGGGGGGQGQGSYGDPWRGVAVPGGLVDYAGSQEPTVIESELCSMKVIFMHKPTHEPWRESTREYPYAWHLTGRKRLWETRLQMRLKRLPESRCYFGISLGGYVPVSGFTSQVQSSLVRAIRGIVGEIYHSPGDNPKRVQGELEPPTFVMPLWAFDQFVISEPGEEPDIVDDLDGVGMKRTDGIKPYVRAMQAMLDSWSTEKVYTFCFWGISQFLDQIKWEICGGFLPGLRMDINKLCGSPPAFVDMYEMPDQGEDKRHLLSRRCFFFRYAVWSELRPPKPEVLQELLGKDVQEAEIPREPRKPKLSFAQLFHCCTARNENVGQQ
mmetsp:Transcript_50687/g.156921  ORF Transcript_50687/g.156921 Transcript_50687/m.156921 type:complete len:446 (+) Transcript_50687:169-1506(+)